MKKQLLLSFLSLGLLLSSCSSDEPAFAGGAEPSTRQVPVSFNLSTDKEFSTLKSTSPEDAGIKSLTYLVYKASDGAYVKYKTLYAGKDDLNVVNDTLAEGQYKVIILASQIPNQNSYEGNHFLDPDDFIGANKSFDEASYISRNIDYDHYSNTFDLNVTNGANVQSVSLKRITAKLEIVPSDVASIPGNIESVTFGIKHITAQSVSFAKKTYFPYYELNPSQLSTIYIIKKTYSRDEFLKLSETNPASIVLFPISSPSSSELTFPIEVTFNLAGNQVPWSQTIKKEYILESNKTLRLTGTLFATDGNIDGTITVDSEWNSEVIEGRFE